MAGKVNKIINVKVEGVGKIKQLEESLKKLRKQQRDIKKDMKDGANAGKHAEQQYKKNENAIKGQSKALRDTKKAMLDANNTTKKATSLQNSMAMGVIKGAAAFSILVTAFRRVSQALTTLIGTFTEFEFTMAKVKAVSGANAEEFKKLSDSAQELGRSTFFTASEVANLQLNLSKLGFTTPEILAATEATINLSIATGSDLARSATVAGNAVRGFQLDATETGRVVDVMAVAFTSSALDIEKWQTSMTKVAPIATMAGFSIEETTAIMAKLSDTGIEASIAGTSLRNIFLKMQDPTSELTRKVGHTIHSLEDMLTVFKDMQDEGTDLADVLTFMDVRQVAAFGTMLEGADDIKVLVEELENADGAGQRMADTVGDTLQGGIFRVKSALQGLSIAIVEKFGGALKKNLVKFADWLNKIVNTEGALEKIGTKIKWVTRILLGYLIQVKATVVWSKLAGSAFFTMATGAQRAATMVRVLTVSVGLFTRAIAKTGIGLLVVGLGELAASWLFSSNSAEKYISSEDKVNKSMVDTLTEVEKVNQTLKSLKKTREKINKTNDDSVLSQEKLKLLRKQEKNDIDVINGYLKTYNKELIDQKDNIDDITTSTKSLITAMKDKALAQIFTDLTAEILKAKVGADTIKNQMDDYLRTQMPGVKGEDSYASKSISDIAQDVKDEFTYSSFSFATSGTKNRYKHKEKLKDMLDDYGMTIDDFIEATKSGYYDDKVKEVKKVIEGLTSTSLVDLLSPPSADDDDDDGPKSQPYKKTLEEMTTEFLTEIDRTISAVDLKVAELEAKRDAIAKFLKQKGVKGSEAEPKAELEQQKVLAALEDAYYAQSLDKLKRALEEDKNTLKASAEFQALTTAEQNVKLAELDTEFYKNKQLALIVHNQEMDAIRSKIAQDKLAREGLDLEAADDKLTKQYEVDKLNLDLALANEEITETQHKEFMLHLEAMYLAQKAALYAGHGEALATINNQIKANDIQTTEQLIDSMNSYIGKIGELGGHMTDLAGEEEKLAGLRKAGVIITQVAATAESILAIATTVRTLATTKGNVADAIKISMTGASVASDVSKTASTVALAGATFLKSIADGIRNMPWWAQLLGIVAIVAAISKAKKAISSSFQTPDAGGGSSDSGGGGSSSGGGGGMMSLMTFGGRHQTVGEVDSYADGGMVHGKSHAQGGEKFAVGGRVVELEGGEAVINKRSTAMFRSQLSAMNTAGGGARFADGGIANVPSFSQTQFQVDGQRGLQGAIGQKSKVVVVESDITKSQNTVTTIQSEASF